MYLYIVKQTLIDIHKEVAVFRKKLSGFFHINITIAKYTIIWHRFTQKETLFRCVKLNSSFPIFHSYAAVLLFLQPRFWEAIKNRFRIRQARPTF